MDELANEKADISAGILCYEQLHVCVGGLCWCCFGGHGYCYTLHRMSAKQHAPKHKLQ